MTIEQVMAMEGRELDAAVAEKVFGWGVVWLTDALGRNPLAIDPLAERTGPHSTTTRMSGASWQRGRLDSGEDIETYGRWLPLFSADWNAAMRIREWAKQGGPSRSRAWIEALAECETSRNRPSGFIRFGSDVVLHTEPIDLARAALLVTP